MPNVDGIVCDNETYGLIAQEADQLTTAHTIDGVEFDGSTDIAHYAVCNTAAATSAKEASITGFSLVAGAMAIIKFTDGNTASSPTLNISSTGAKSIINGGWNAGDTITFVYDGTNYQTVSIKTDTTLTVPNQAADAEATGDAIKNNYADCVYFFDYPFLLVNDPTASSVVVTTETGKIIKKDGTVADSTAYNIATFTAHKDSVYKITHLTGSSYTNLRSVVLCDSGGNTLYWKLPTANETATTYVSNFDGLVKVCYRAVNASSFSVTIQYVDGEYWTATGSFGIDDMPVKSWTYCNQATTPFTDAHPNMPNVIVIHKTPMANTLGRFLMTVYSAANSFEYWNGIYIVSTNTITWSHFSSDGTGAVLANNTDVNNITFGNYLLVNSYTYNNIPALAVGKQCALSVFQNRTSNNAAWYAYQKLVVDVGTTFYRLRGATAWGMWFVANANINANLFLRSDGTWEEDANATSSLVVTTTADKAVNGHGDIKDMIGYNIAEFVANKEQSYAITALSGTNYNVISLITFTDNTAITGYVVPDANEKYKYVVSGYSGNVIVTYRAVDSTSIGIAVVTNMDSIFDYTNSMSIMATKCYVDTNGNIVASIYDTIAISEPIALNFGETITAKFSATTSMAAISVYNGLNQTYTPQIIGTGNNEVVSFVADMPCMVCFSGAISDAVEYTITGNRNRSIEIAPDISWGLNLLITKYGSLTNTVYTSYKLSNPIPVIPGDIVTITGRLSTFTALAWTPQQTVVTYQGTSYLPLIDDVTSGSTEETRSCVIKRQGYVIVSLNTSYDYNVTIQRTKDYNAQYLSTESTNTILYGELRHNYVEQYDYVPLLDNKDVNSIFLYDGDTKANNNYIANAVAYPNGEIIACRSGSGEVVKIDNSGTETVLMTIANAQDWRGVFMDSNLNVYVSPHSATFNPGIAQTARGLYKLPYGSNTFVKVINLYESAYTIQQWAANTVYSVNDTVFYMSSFYCCTTAHTSGDDFDPDNWGDFPVFAANTSYNAGDIVTYRSNWYIRKTSGTSGNTFAIADWYPATACMTNDDTIWTMCEDCKGHLYAGVYAHSIRRNPAVYKSLDGGNTWFYQSNFINNGTLPLDKFGNLTRHVHCINYNEYDDCLYAAVGEVNTICKSSDFGVTWFDMEAPCFYGQPTYVLGVKDGLVVGSDGHYSCGVTKIMTDGTTIKSCGRTAPGFIFNIRRSDLTGWLYAFTRIDNYVAEPSHCPTPDCINDPAALENWKENVAESYYLKIWTDYNAWATKYYPEDAIRPQNAVMMVSRDNGETWEVFYKEKVSQNYSSICGFITAGYFRDGECLVGNLMPIDDTASGKSFVNPIIISEGKKRRTSEGYDLAGEIFIKTNNSNTVSY